MTSGVTGRLPRLAHEPTQYHQWTIPPSTPVSQSNYFVNNDPSIFPDPLLFRPERWIEAAERDIRLEKYMVSFGRGSRSCVGINLAWAELYLTLAHVVVRFDMVPFETVQERDVVINRDFFMGVPKVESRGIRVKVKMRQG
jgi:cytochrome P450